MDFSKLKTGIYILPKRIENPCWDKRFRASWKKQQYFEAGQYRICICEKWFNSNKDLVIAFYVTKYGSELPVNFTIVANRVYHFSEEVSDQQEYEKRLNAYIELLSNLRPAKDLTAEQYVDQIPDADIRFVILYLLHADEITQDRVKSILAEK